MNIREAIDKATKIPEPTEEATFVRMTKPDKSAIDRGINKKKVKPPRNIKLLESDDSEPFDWTNLTLNESEIASSISAVNGGVSYSNKSCEEYWKNKQLQRAAAEAAQCDAAEAAQCDAAEAAQCVATEAAQYDAIPSTSKSACSSSSINETLQTENKESNESKETTENLKDSNTVHEVLKKCNLSKNAVISGLLNSNQITVKDLKIPKNSNLGNEKSQNQSSTHTKDISMGECLVEHPTELDVFIHPLQMAKRFEKTNDGAAGLVVEHVGVKKTITPRQYYINETDDKSFEFVKKNAKDK